MPGQQFGVLHKGMYVDTKKGAASSKSGGMTYSGQSGTVRDQSGSFSKTPAANVQHNSGGGRKY